MYWERCIFALLVFSIVATFTIVTGVDHKKFSVCGPTTTSDESSNLIFITTLDGKISALDLTNNGEKKWTVDFNDGPLLSSNIHRRELNNDGRWVRLIPSLNGGLYKFDGENIESMPVTTDQLLRSSYRYSDDLVFSGGKETRSYGVSSKTGKIIYQCNINGCTNMTDGDSYINQQDILIIKRYQQTVRAVEPRTGQERWNYSVGQHELIVIPHENRNCNDNSLNNIMKNIDVELKAIVPDGVIWATTKNNPTMNLWKHKFDSPIVSIWRENTQINNDDDNKLQQIDLFDSSQWKWGVEFTVCPGIYIGMHNRQLYVQENIDKKKLFKLPKSESTNIYPWQPYPAIENAIALKDINYDENEYNALLDPNYEPQATALSVLYNSEYINGNGFYLFADHQSENLYRCNHTKPSNHHDDEVKTENKTVGSSIASIMKIIISSLWYWWREVTIVSVTTAFILNYIVTQRLINATTRTNNAVVTPIIVERHIEMKPVEEETIKVSIAENCGEFKSRYLSDFEPINCLGAGGYGVVFEAKNKIDDCNYAIKRIVLPNSKDSRDRVMREVKALAKLDHHNIVRYFHAWLECPPAGWQEEHDHIYINKQLLSQCPTTTTDDTTTNTKDSRNAVCIDVPSSENSSVDSAIEAVALNCKNDDSFIIFNSSHSGESEITEEYDDDLSSTHGSSASKVTNNNSLHNNDNYDDDSFSIVFKDLSENSNKKQNNSLCNNDNYDDESSSIVFKDSSENSNEKQNKFKKQRNSMNLNEKRKNVNKKSPKMFLYIQMQLCQRSSLRKWLRQEKSRDYSHIVNIFQQIVDAVEYVHLQGLIHRDLKPSNVFFAYDDKVKIGDFGLVTTIPEGCNGHNPCTSDEDGIYINNCDSIIAQKCNHTACVGTTLYMAPEQMNEQIYDYKVDIYSLGIILFELLMPFDTEMERAKAIIDLRNFIFPSDFASNYPKEYDLLKMMLDDDPNMRPTTFGMKARPPLSNCATSDKSTLDDSKWHFELPQIKRNPSIINNSLENKSAT
ncbi:hypothetical protein PV327_010080 [Microctonus hyperodae]|uniref:non-specific serine/threonine protein kinase n=1 Tax=Microctonus hyperodae TaxID=165561 RepID=A0AA39F2A6_MICHY|nr:hypothetical protein PV327_010080 [Microctonus hyperodae]